MVSIGAAYRRELPALTSDTVEGVGIVRLVRLPFAPPLEPMLSKAADVLPEGDGWQFEPKWDGFRTLVFRDRDEILLQSRDGKPLNRYFPELVSPLIAAFPEPCVVDGGSVIVCAAGVDFVP